MGKRADWGVRESWEGNYLANTKDNPEAATFQSALRNMRNKDGFREVSLLMPGYLLILTFLFLN